MAERRIAAPLGQQHVAEIFVARVAGLQQGAVLALVAQADHVVQELQDQRDAGRLPRVSTGVLGVGVAVPGLVARPEVAMLGQQIGPALDGLQVARGCPSACRRRPCPSRPGRSRPTG